ncbi:hypothetical protein EVAR_39531_1 [Eumeta japonica]|uniref:Uncharacterized protein n=1 Tax=Eumeta variegata TaxID=151549 RepID=A0A4C1XL88_EUMVA|nr:hypothetical protein EVAR_39531_1 [Eumeta japonica]
MLHAHWLDEEFGLQHRVLQMSHFRGPTADNIRSVLSDLSVNWDIDTRIHLVLRDNGPMCKRSDITEVLAVVKKTESELLPQSQDPHASFWNCFEELASTER